MLGNAVAGRYVPTHGWSCPAGGRGRAALGSNVRRLASRVADCSRIPRSCSRHLRIPTKNQVKGYMFGGGGPVPMRSWTVDRPPRVVQGL